jgi:hypothetical protein
VQKHVDKTLFSAKIIEQGGGKMKKMADIVLWVAVLFALGALADIIGLTHLLPRGFGVTPGGYIRFGTLMVLLSIAFSLREKK